MKYKIKELREQKGMSQEKLSKKANVSRAILSGLETGGRTETTTKTLSKIADALDEEICNIFLL